MRPEPEQKRKLFTLERGKTALLIVDMQNDFVRRGGLIYVEDAGKTIPNIQRLIQFFRREKMPVLYTRANVAPLMEVPSLARRYYEVLYPKWLEEKACVKGHLRYYPDVGQELDCADIVEEIYPEPGDIVIEKAYRNGFENTILEYTLRALRVEYLAVVGTATHVCVDCTAKAAFDKQFMVAMVSDGVSSYLPDLHEATLKGFMRMWGRVVTTEEVIHELT